MIIVAPHLNLAYISHKGPIQSEGFTQLVMDLVSHPLYVPGLNILYDYRRADFSTIQREDMDRVHKYLMIQRNNLYGRLAIVVGNHDDYITASLWQSRVGDLPHNRKVFKSISEGESWLFDTATEQIKNRYHEIIRQGNMAKNTCEHHVVGLDGTILNSTITTPLDGIPLQGRNISDILHESYAYPFLCLLRNVLKTGKHAWINLRVRTHDYADCIAPLDPYRALVSEILISGMGDYEVERLKWLDNVLLPKFLQACPNIP